MKYLKVTSSPWDLLSKQENIYFLKNSQIFKKWIISILIEEYERSTLYKKILFTRYDLNCDHYDDSLFLQPTHLGICLLCSSL